MCVKALCNIYKRQRTQLCCVYLGIHQTPGWAFSVEHYQVPDEGLGSRGLFRWRAAGGVLDLCCPLSEWDRLSSRPSYRLSSNSVTVIIFFPISFHFQCPQLICQVPTLISCPWHLKRPHFKLGALWQVRWESWFTSFFRNRWDYSGNFPQYRVNAKEAEESLFPHVVHGLQNNDVFLYIYCHREQK